MERKGSESKATQTGVCYIGMLILVWVHKFEFGTLSSKDTSIRVSGLGIYRICRILVEGLERKHASSDGPGNS